MTKITNAEFLAKNAELLASAELQHARDIAAHFVSAGEVARRTGMTPQAVSNWLSRGDTLTAVALVATIGGVKMMWWPGVKTWLADRSIPFSEPALKLPTQHTCLACGMPVLPDELELAITNVSGATAGTTRYRHFYDVDCQAALRSMS